MAANDYYQGQNQKPFNDIPTPTPYSQGVNTPSPQSTPAPAYQSAYSAPSQSFSPAPASHGAAQTSQNQHQPTPTPPPTHGAGNSNSPFDTVFDDHVYPANPANNSRPNPAASSSGDMSQNGYYNQDTGYYSHYNQQPPQQPGHGPEDIPLQDRPNKDAEMNDHIYDAPGGHSGSKKKKKKGVGLGELGMFGADKKRIPWVVYIFTLVQIGVFIGEIVRNCK